MNRESLPWLSEYAIHGVPKTLKPYPDLPVYEILYQAAKKNPKMGFIQFDYKMTYPEARENVDRLATAFHKLGLRKGDRIATILPTSIQYVLADYGISRAGLIHIPCSHLEPAQQLEHKFKESSPKAIICLANYADLAEGLVRKGRIKHLILARLEEYSTPLVKTTGYEDVFIPRGALWMTDLIANTPAAPPDIVFDVEHDLETLLFTGGTTGLAKGCMLTHRNIYANCMQNIYSMGQIGPLLQGSLSVLVGLPFFHSYGHVIMHTMTMFGHNQILIPDPRDTDEMIRMIRKHYPLIQLGVPTQFMKLADELKGIGIIGISGSAALPVNTQVKFETKAGGGIMEGYGLSEMSPCTHLNTTFLMRVFGGRTLVRLFNLFIGLPGVTPVLNAGLRLLGPRLVGRFVTKLIFLLGWLTKKKADASNSNGDRNRVERRGTIGVPFPDMEITFLSVETGREIPMADMIRGERGEMLLRGPQRMLGYWPKPGSGIDKEGYIHTGDVVTVDDKGYFYIVDRTKDMIIVSGYKVYSRELDEILYNHPKIEMAATVGIPDPKREGSERIAVYIQPKAKYRNDLTEKEIIEFLKKRVARYAVPRMVRIIDNMPLTEVQKVNKKLLREMAAHEPRKTASKKDAGKKHKSVSSKKR